MNANEQRIFDALLDKGEASPRELSTELGIGQRQMQRYLKRLVERGLVERAGYGKYQVRLSPELLERAKKIRNLGRNT